MVEKLGLEPRTNSTSHCHSTIELSLHRIGNYTFAGRSTNSIKSVEVRFELTLDSYLLEFQLPLL